MRWILLLTIILPASNALANDWPNWRGPTHDGISTETGWTARWPAEGPPRLWKTSLGVGFSSVSVSHGRVYTMGNHNDVDTVFCIDAGTGKVIWKQSYPCPTDPMYYEGGPSATPTVDGDFVYTLSRKGHLFCYRATDGRVVWSKNIATDLGLEIPQWGFASSGLVQGSMVLFNVGTHGAAFDKATGKVLWLTGKLASGYSTPLPYEWDGKNEIALMTASGAGGVDLATGKALWSYPWKADYNLNIAEPVITGKDEVFVTSTYTKSDALLQIHGGTVKTLWKNGNLLNQLNSSVLVGDCIYGVNGIAGPSRSAKLACIDLKTGASQWNFEPVGGGALMVADGKIIALSDRGELFVAPASPKEFKPISSAQVLGGKCWTVPVLANGHIYCRNAKGDLVCLDVSGR